jgi:endonuclease/exonuclease/phosphatase (EEP) superfamily protein YafD
MYRPPSTPLRVFFQQFYDLLLNFCKNGEILLLGDFNTPFSSNLTTNYNLTMLLSEFSLTQHVQDATLRRQDNVDFLFKTDCVSSVSQTWQVDTKS